MEPKFKHYLHCPNCGNPDAKWVRCNSDFTWPEPADYCCDACVQEEEKAVQ